ncbi:Cytidine deaminase [Tetrabaena socialis]|uniref:Cytidine deaminase n=1 Tax=Tetrabaena socialis TaxID=47790 RepID=A0A2J7ZPK7_9CHLO|nr:Cytidine deaminase [Tetrabaena socialis]|eukprot:PNH02207.1 Cytidine deaminase [Tetrabaena socialis]
MTSHGGLLLGILSSYLSLSAAHDACDTKTWDAVALRGYCATPGAAAYRSPACSVFRLCDSGTADPPLGAQVCNVSRAFVTLCVDQPGLAECQTFRQGFHYPENYTSCVAAKSFKISSTNAVQSFMASSCTGGHKMAGCSDCNATACSTQDPLLAYTAACTDMLMSGCEPYIAFCAQETPAAAQLMCRAAKDRTTATTTTTTPASNSTAQAPPFASDPCVLDSTQPACVSYTYPDSAANADIAKLCGSMPDMPGCAIVAACEEVGPGAGWAREDGSKSGARDEAAARYGCPCVRPPTLYPLASPNASPAQDHGEVAAKYCRPFVLLSTLCADMPGMHGCENYKLLCRKAGSTVAQCTQQPAVPGTPTWSTARNAVFSACSDHPMAGCAACSAADCPDPLASLADICHEMPNMAVCAPFWNFCNAAGADDVAKWCADDSAKAPGDPAYSDDPIHSRTLAAARSPITTCGRPEAGCKVSGDRGASRSSGSGFEVQRACTKLMMLFPDGPAQARIAMEDAAGAGLLPGAMAMAGGKAGDARTGSDEDSEEQRGLLHRDAQSAASQRAATAPGQCSSSHAADRSPLKGRFRIPAPEVTQLLESSGLSLEELLFSLIGPASQLARPPISGFHVGAVALGGSGSIYVGVNIEFPQAPLNNSIHAEQCLLVNCLHAGETSIRALAVSAAPCGHCRWVGIVYGLGGFKCASLNPAWTTPQFFAEMKDVDSLEYIFGKDAKPKYLTELLPERFGPADLQDEPFPLLLERQHNAVAWSAQALAAVAARGDDAAFQEAATDALLEARQCYAPYTRCHSGAALITADGRVFSGGYIESAAFNPSLSPFHSAVVDAVTQGIASFDQITEVVLAERPGANAQHAANIRLLLDRVAPSAVLTVLPMSP